MARRNKRRHVDGFALPVPFAGIVVIGVVIAIAIVVKTHNNDKNNK